MDIVITNRAGFVPIVQGLPAQTLHGPRNRREALLRPSLDAGENMVAVSIHVGGSVGGYVRDCSRSRLAVPELNELR